MARRNEYEERCEALKKLGYDPCSLTIRQMHEILDLGQQPTPREDIERGILGDSKPSDAQNTVTTRFYAENASDKPSDGERHVSDTADSQILAFEPLQLAFF